MWFASSEELKQLSVERIKQMWNVMLKKKGCPFKKTGLIFDSINYATLAG